MIRQAAFRNWVFDFRFGLKADIAPIKRDVRFTPKADIDELPSDVRFVPKAD
jgi:hypothetical protein